MTKSAKPKPASRVIRKVTVLDGYYASADWDSFCFDRCPHPAIHSARYPNMPAKLDAKAPRRFGPEKCPRIYAEDLLPRTQSDASFGRWRVTVEFEPRRMPARDQKALTEMTRRQHAAVRAAEAKRKKDPTSE